LDWILARYFFFIWSKKIGCFDLFRSEHRTKPECTYNSDKDEGKKVRFFSGLALKHSPVWYWLKKIENMGSEFLSLLWPPINQIIPTSFVFIPQQWVWGLFGLVFIPFFTKADRSGRGSGLACYNLVTWCSLLLNSGNSASKYALEGISKS